jgi:hypothetical protein
MTHILSPLNIFVVIIELSLSPYYKDAFQLPFFPLIFLTSQATMKACARGADRGALVFVPSSFSVYD